MKNPPLKLYKYRALPTDPDLLSHTTRIFSHQEVYFASLESFNDPFEGQMTLSCNATLEQKKNRYRNHLQRSCPGLSNRQVSDRVRDFFAKNCRDLREFENNARQRLQDLTLRETGVFSLSATHHSTLMWSHYADHHTGICIEFSVMPPVPGKPLQPVHYHQIDFLGAASPVTYSDTFPTANWYLDDRVDTAKMSIL